MNKVLSMSEHKIFIILLLYALLQTTAAQYQWRCSGYDSANDKYYLPDFGGSLTWMLASTQLISGIGHSYVYPAYQISCPLGDVTAVEFCYSVRSNKLGNGNLPTFLLLSLNHTRDSFTVTRSIPVNSAPATDKCSTRTGTRQCCDVMTLSTENIFQIPEENFAIGVTIPASTKAALIGIHPSNMIYRVPFYFTAMSLQAGNTYDLTGSLVNNEALRLLRLHIKPLPTCTVLLPTRTVLLPTTTIIVFPSSTADMPKPSNTVSGTTSGVSSTSELVNAPASSSISASPATTQVVAVTQDSNAGTDLGPLLGGVLGGIISVLVLVILLVFLALTLVLRHRVHWKPNRSGDMAMDNAMYVKKDLVGMLNGTSRRIGTSHSSSEYAEVGPFSDNTPTKSEERSKENCKGATSVHFWKNSPSSRIGCIEPRNAVFQVSNGYEPAGVINLATLHHSYNQNPPEYDDIYMVPVDNVNGLYAQLEQIQLDDVSRENICLGGSLGSGQFGDVFHGTWECSRGSIEVAVKTLKESSDEDDKVRFLQEAAIMGQFKHPNVVTMHGVVTEGEPVLLVLEMLKKGDLRNYLLSMRTDDGVNPEIDEHELLSYCRQVVSGMVYLSNKDFVHRDLAARNILVSDDRICKIADFGMSRDLADENYYVSRGGMIPVKWTAPEAIHYKKYSTASDVWSYGVVMYEIWSIGHKPLEGVTNVKVIEFINSGYRLPPPPGCPRAIYNIMISCWQLEADHRPDFTEVSTQLSVSNSKLLHWSQEDKSNFSEASRLGADLTCARKLYIDLQLKYKPNNQISDDYECI